MRRITFEVDNEIKNKITVERTKQGISEKEYMNSILTSYFKDTRNKIDLKPLYKHLEEQKSTLKNNYKNNNNFEDQIKIQIDLIKIESKLDLIKIIIEGEEN